MTLPTPKFSIGDRVWGSSFYEHSQCHEVCPDCLGQREWSVTTPSGDAFQSPCATCLAGYESTGQIVVWKPSVRTEVLAICSVRIDTEDREHPVSYMCRETGVGSGTVWNEDRLHATEEAARSHGEEQARKFAESENARLNSIRVSDKRQPHRKPSLSERVIKDLQKQVAALTAKVPQ